METLLVFLSARIGDLETRVKKLEENQLYLMKKIDDYINDSETIANMQQKDFQRG